jgi:G3E family GTPase
VGKNDGREVAVTLVSGFCRAGKSSLIQHVLACSGGSMSGSMKVAAGTVVATPASVDEVMRQARDSAPDHLLLEASSISEPFGLCELVSSAVAYRVRPRLDTFVTVVDARRFLVDWQSGDDVEAPLSQTEESYALVDLLCEQVEFADVLVVNKLDLVDARELARLRAFLSLVNPRAAIVDAVKGRVALNSVLGTGRFDFDRTLRAAGPSVAFDSAPASDEIKSHVFRARRPFHPERFYGLLGSDLFLRGVLRSKGEFWLASRMEMKGFWSQAGCAACHHGAAPWYASRDRALWPDAPRARERIEAAWAEPWGDRRQKFSFVGTAGMDELALDRALDAALLSGAEMELGPSGWNSFRDPFPIWNQS